MECDHTPCGLAFEERGWRSGQLRELESRWEHWEEGAGAETILGAE